MRNTRFNSSSIDPMEMPGNLMNFPSYGGSMNTTSENNSGTKITDEPKECREKAAVLYAAIQKHHTENAGNWTTDCEETHKAMVARMIAYKQHADRTTSLDFDVPRRSHDRYTDNGAFLSMRAKDGSEIHGVRAGQRFTDIPGVGKPDNPNAIGELMRVIATNDRSHMSSAVGNVLSSNTGTSGGYLVPSAVLGSVIDLATPQNRLSQSGMPIFNMSGNQLSMPKVERRPVPEVKMENDRFSESDLQFSLVNVIPRMFGFMIRVSHELMADGARVEEVITSECAKAIATAIDYRGINGSDPGAGEAASINGLVNFDIPQVVVDDASWLDWSQFATSAQMVRRANHEPTGALLNVDDAHELNMLTDTQGRWLGAPPTVSNIPRADSTNVPSGNVFVGDFSNYALALREGVTIEATKYAGEAFERAQWLFRVMWRGNYTMLDQTAFSHLKKLPA